MMQSHRFVHSRRGKLDASESCGSPRGGRSSTIESPDDPTKHPLHEPVGNSCILQPLGRGVWLAAQEVLLRGIHHTDLARAVGAGIARRTETANRPTSREPSTVNIPVKATN